MAGLYVPKNSIELAKDLSFELATRDEIPTEELILGTLHVMNSMLYAEALQEERHLIGADLIYELPDHDADLEMLSDDEVDQSVQVGVAVTAKIEQIVWMGTMSFRGFGLRVFGVDYKKPHRRHTPTGFIPLDYLGPILAA